MGEGRVGVMSGIKVVRDRSGQFKLLPLRYLFSQLKFISLSGLFCLLVLSLGLRGEEGKQLTSACEGGRESLECVYCSTDPHHYLSQDCWSDLVSGISPLKKSVVGKHVAFSPCLEKAHDPPFPGPILALTIEYCTVNTLPRTPDSGLAYLEQLIPSLSLWGKSPSTWQPIQTAQSAIFHVSPCSMRKLLDPSTVHRSQERSQNANSITLSLYTSLPF